MNGFRIVNSTAPKATVTAIGANSFNADTTSGFFQINNISGEDIARVVMDWSRVENDANLSMLWDPDQGGMADRFERRRQRNSWLCRNLPERLRRHHRVDL